MQKAILFDPMNGAVWKLSAQLNAQIDHISEALHEYDNAIKASPNNPDLYVEQGKLYLLTEAPEQARKDFEAALRLEPNKVPVLRMLLTSLYHPTLKLSYKDESELEQQRLATYNILKNIDPKAAEEVMAEVKGSLK